MLRRTTLTAVFTAVLLGAGLLSPVAATAPADVPATVAERLDGLPAERGADGLSRPVTTPIAFSMVGFEVPAGAAVRFRTSVDGRDWDRWTDVDIGVDEGPDEAGDEPRTTRRLSEPVWVGAARHLQTRVVGRRGPQDVAAHLIDSAGLSRSWPERLADRLQAAWRGTPAVATATARRPGIVTRAQWGADERLRRGDPAYADAVDLGIVHHTAGSNSYSRREAPAVVRGIYRYHTGSQGWNDIGYNALIDRYGTIYEGRYGGLRRAVIGAHAGGFNTGSFGVSLLGTFETASPTSAAQDALVRLLAWKFDLHHVDVLGTTRYVSFGSTRYQAGTAVTLPTLIGHRDVSSTTCPGDRLYALLPRLRGAVVAEQGPVLLDHHAAPDAVRVAVGASVDGPIRFSARLRPGGEWRLTVRGRDGNVVHSASGRGRTARSTWAPASSEPGRYRYRFTSRGRRAAGGPVELVTPVIRARTRPTAIAVKSGGVLAQSARLWATVYPAARWTATLTAPDGRVVSTARGTGETATASWRGPARVTGRYHWEVSAPGVDPVERRFTVFADLVKGVGVARSAPAAAVGISRRSFPDGGAERAVLANPEAYVQAIAAAPLAGRRGPLLYSRRGALDAGTLAELRRALPPGRTVYVVGGSATLHTSVARALRQSWTVVRVAGRSPTATAAKVADVVLAGSGRSTAVVVDGDGRRAWRQGVAAAGLAASRGIPVLATGSDTLAAPVRDTLARNGVTETIIVANRKAIAPAVADALPRPRRVAGPGAPATAVAVARRLWRRRATGDGDAFMLAAGDRDDGWVRAVAAAPLAARASAPLLLVSADTVAGSTRGYLDGLGYTQGARGRAWALGGVRHVGTRVQHGVSRLLQ